MNRRADTWMMPNLRGMTGVLGSGLSMIAAGVVALVFVSVLLAFHGWPGVETTGTVPRIVAVTATTATEPSARLVIGSRATAAGRAGATSARRAKTSPAAGHGALRSLGVTHHEGSHAAPPTAPAPKHPTVPIKVPSTPPVTVPDVPVPNVPNIVNQVAPGAAPIVQSAGQAVNSTLQTASNAVGGVLGVVAKVVSGGH